jgi:uncharacterized membrane protein YgdD (TMEM256/DUF423 family)
MRLILCAAALMGLSSVIFGAAGDHLLLDNLTTAMTDRFDVALRYHQNYSIVLLAVALYGMTRVAPSRILMAAACLFFLGTLIFCGTLYASLYWQAESLTAGTPIGGLSLMAGWLFLLVYACNPIKKPR